MSRCRTGHRRHLLAAFRWPHLQVRAFKLTISLPQLQILLLPFLLLSLFSAKTYKQLNEEQLVALFGSLLDSAVIHDVLVSNNFDLNKSISQLSGLTGLDPFAAPAEAADADAPSHSSQQDSDEKQRPRCVVHEQKGDLFSCDDSVSLAHCISADLRLGKGIAVAFRNKFDLMRDLRAQGKGVGQVAAIKRGSRFIFNLITKQQYFQKPQLQDLRACLEQMCQHCVANDVAELAMPRIGCGLDGLLWHEVKALIEEVFAGSGVRITVFNL